MCVREREVCMYVCVCAVREKRLYIDLLKRPGSAGVGFIVTEPC